MTTVRISCRWCGKPNRTPSAWEQEHLKGGWYRLCVRCANKRVGISGLLSVRKAEEAT